MATAVFVDTNVLLYAEDSRDERKHAAAVALIRSLDPRRVYVSAQVLSEFANVVTHSRKSALPPSKAIESVRRMAAAWNVLAVDADTVIVALAARDRWQMSYYDAQIWAAAALGAVPVVLSEDFADGTVLGGVAFADPFAEGFELDGLR
jgi:predicted nucleic acid-binding protein